MQIRGVWDFEKQFPRDLDPWFLRQQVSNVRTWFDTTSREQVFRLPNPFKGITTVEPGRESGDGVEVYIQPRRPGRPTPQSSAPAESTLILRVTRKGVGEPISGAEVIVQGRTGKAISGKTGSLGEVTFRLPAQTYTISVSAGRFKPESLPVVLTQAQTVTREVLLQPLAPTIKDRAGQVWESAGPWLKLVVPGVLMLFVLLWLLRWLRRRALG